VAIIRKAAQDDASAIARIYIESWRSTYAGLLPDRLLLNMSGADHEARWWRAMIARGQGRLFYAVAEDAREGVVGFGSAGPSRDPRLKYSAEVYTLYLRDDFHGAGLGRRLFVSLGERCAESLGGSLVVWVLKGNPARYFYESLGGKHVARRPTRLGGAEIEELAFAWDEVSELIALGRSGRA
jgi:GNAT superfamily N-acetyltransferase